MDKALVQVLLVWSVGWLTRYAAGATGNKQLSGMLKVATIMACISIAAPAVWEALSGIAGALAAAKEWTDNAEQKMSWLQWLLWFGAPGGAPGGGGR